MPFAPSSFFFLVVRPGAPSSFLLLLVRHLLLLAWHLFLVAMPGAFGGAVHPFLPEVAPRHL